MRTKTKMTKQEVIKERKKMLEKSKQFKTVKNNLSLILGYLFIVVFFSSPTLGQHYAYISNAGVFMDGMNDDLSIIDLGSNTVIATIPVGDGPQGVAINPAGTAVYVANTTSNEFTVIDAITHTATTLPAGSGPGGVAVHPDGSRIYLAHMDFPTGELSNVSVIDRATNTIIDEIFCGKGSIGVAVHPNGKVAYVTNASEGSIAVFDTDTHEVIDTIVLEAAGENEPCVPVPLAIHPEGTYVYAANRIGPTLWAINTATHETTARAFGHQHVGMAVNPAGTVLYLPDFYDEDPNLPPHGTMDVIDAETLDLTTTIDGLNLPLDVSVHPDGTRLYITNTGNDTVSVIDAATYALIETIEVGSQPNAYGECVGPGVPRLLKADAVARLETVKKAIEGCADGVVSPARAIQHLETALVSGNLCLQEELWSAANSGDVDPRRLHSALGDAVFSYEATIVEAVLDAIRRGWIVNEDIRSELLAIVDEAVRADRVLAAVAIDDAILAEVDPEEIGEAQGMLEAADALVKEAAVWQEVDKKASLLFDAINQYRNAWDEAVDLI
jgi:YVTN family beta-propeller protein